MFQPIQKSILTMTKTGLVVTIVASFVACSHKKVQTDDANLSDIPPAVVAQDPITPTPFPLAPDQPIHHAKKGKKSHSKKLATRHKSKHKKSKLIAKHRKHRKVPALAATASIGQLPPPPTLPNLPMTTLVGKPLVASSSGWSTRGLAIGLILLLASGIGFAIRQRGRKSSRSARGRKSSRLIYNS